jgi:CRISPR system Cascade subunit CasE
MSSAKPDWSGLDANYLLEAEENPACKRIGENYAAVENGMKLMFRLRANPTKRVGKSDGRANDKFKPSDERKIRRRVEIRTDEDKIAWLKRKGEEAGFRLANVQLKEDVSNVASVEQGKISFSKSGNSSLLTFGSVTFEGVLEVTDADKFRESLVQGIGTGKAYGFGLLSIAPVKEK